MAIAFNAIGGDIVQQRRTMLSRGCGAGQLRIFAEHLLQTWKVAAHDGVGSGFESSGRGTLAREFHDVAGKFGPTVEAVQTRDYELACGERTRSNACLCG